MKCSTFTNPVLSSRALCPGPIGQQAVQTIYSAARAQRLHHGLNRAGKMDPGNKCRDDSGADWAAAY